MVTFFQFDASSWTRRAISPFRLKSEENRKKINTILMGLLMDKSKIRTLAESWIKIHRTLEGSNEYKDNFWAYSDLCDFCEKDPEVCFEIIQKIRSIDHSDIILSNLAAGPLEDLLVNHGEIFIDRIEKIAVSDSQMRKLLGAVWKNSILDSVWKRIKAIADDSW